MDNMTIYAAVREVPQNAQKPIQAGRLKGMTDINPMWRIQELTKQFGPVGIGWYYKTVRKWTEDGADGTKCAFVDIELYIKDNDKWSAPIEGTGGSMFIAKEKSGLYTSDEAYKMALTDAISVACKALGFGADVYWQGGRTKYTAAPEADFPNADKIIGNKELEKLNVLLEKLPDGGAAFLEYAKNHYKVEDITKLTFKQYGQALVDIGRKLNSLERKQCG